MSNYFFKMLFAMLVCLWHTQVSILGFISQSHVTNIRCMETERQALLNFKHGLIYDQGMLSTWSDDENKSDCCKWKGIQCNNQTSHVQVLDLHADPDQYIHGALNLTSLIHLTNIEYLDLSYNFFLWSQIPQLIGSFTNLRYLNLSYSGFVGGIPSELGNLSHLEYLDLSENYLNRTIPIQLGKLTSLRYLDLNYNYLDGAIPFQVGNLPILRTLRLEGNFNLTINSANWLSSLSSLTTLDLSSLDNLGSSHHWLQMISELVPNLRELRLVGCSLSDDSISSLFPSHSNFSTSLSILDLSQNMLTSSTCQLLLNYSHNLHILDLSDNMLTSSTCQLLLNYSHNLHILDLSSNMLTSSTCQLLLNYSRNLRILDLSSNNLTSFIFHGNFNLSSKLQELHLANCDLTYRSFLVPSAAIKNSSSSLVTLNLGTNLLKSPAIYHWIFNFTTNLHILRLDDNLLEGPVPSEFGKVMKHLEVLDMGFNKLQGEIPPSLGNICTLEELYLGNNNLSGEISIFVQNSSWCNRHVFQTLYLPSNQLTGMLPNVSTFTSLRRLDLSNNQLSGEIPRSIGLLRELQELHLEGNNLEGDINELHFTNLSKLMELDLTDNSLSLKFGTTWVPPFQLYQLGLASCKLGPNFPSWLQSQSRLNFLDISDAGIDDFVPEWFWNKPQTISTMNMSYNRLKGTIPNLPLNPTYNEFNAIILNSNQFEGGIPAFFSQVATLDLSKNKISDLNAFLCRKGATINLLTLDLSNNQIMGQLPDCWEHLTSLEFLDLRNNNLSGQIPQSMGALVNLKALVLRNNRLTGDLPFQLKNCTYLQILDVSENLLSGPIPSWIGERLRQLEILSLRVNGFFGSIPVYLCYLSQIHVLDLSRNNLAGRIPTCLRNFSVMTERSVNTWEIVGERKISSRELNEDIYVSNLLLTWKGQEYVFLNPEYFLKSIDLSGNDLTGGIPKEVGCLLGLVSLNLARNSLDGEIPPEIGNLNELDFLDLSRNHLSGRIPSTLSKIDGLGYLNLSNNHLSGRIPWEGHLQDFDASSFEGNLGLCGQQLNKSCPGEDTGVQPQRHAVHSEDDNSIFYEALYMSLGLGFFIGFWGLLGPILLWKPWRNAYGRFLNKLIDNVFLKVQVKKAKFSKWLKGQQ